MMKHFTSNKIVLFLIILVLLIVSCIQSEKSKKIDESKIKIDIINTILPILVPKYPIGGISIVSNVEKENLEKWQQKNKLEDYDFKKDCDSLGMTLEIIDSLIAPDCDYMLQILSNEKHHSLFCDFINKPLFHKQIDFNKIKNYDKVKIVPVKMSNWDGPERCIGTVQISSFAFNENHTLAAFIMNVHQGGCIPTGPNYTIVVQKTKGKWKIIEK